MCKTSTYTPRATWQLPGISGVSCTHLKQANKSNKCCDVAPAASTRGVWTEHKGQIHAEIKLLNQAETQIKRSKQQFCLFGYYWGCTTPSHLVSLLVPLCWLTPRPPQLSVQNPSPLFCPCFIFPPFYDCKWLELECYRQDEILLHDLTGLNQPTQPGTRPSHNWEAESAPSPAAGTHPMNSPGKLCLLQMRYRDLIMLDFSFFLKKMFGSH